MTTAQHDSQPSIFDFVRLDEITGNDEEFGRELVADYLINMELITTQLENAVAIGSLPDISSAAHSLKGSSLTVGAEAVGVACKALESIARNGDAEGIADAYLRVRLEVTRVDPMIRDWLGRAA